MFSFKRILIFLQIFRTFCDCAHDEVPELKWPEKYSFVATQIHLTSGVLENIQYWRTSTQSRTDYNKGAVKTIINEVDNGVKYEIHPETNAYYLNKLLCAKTVGTDSDSIYVENILPSVDDYTLEGNETLDLGTVSKFTSESDEGDSLIKSTIWAQYDGNSSWIPARIETIVFGSWLDNLQKHIVFDIINFSTNFSDNVFKVDKYNCTTKNNTSVRDEFRKNNSLVDLDDAKHVDHLFKAFKTNYKKQYQSKREEIARRKIFIQNMRYVISHNSQESGYKLGVNKFIDRTPDEMDNLLSLIPTRGRDPGTIPFPYNKHTLAKMLDILPKNFDLRLLGRITPVQEQLDCKSGWTISAASAVAGALAGKNGGKLLRLSNQAILDCAWGFKGQGCDGGNDTSAYRWVLTYGLPTELDYGSYTDKDGFCHIRNITKKYKIQGFTAVTPFSVTALKVALVNHGPVTVSIHASYKLKLYTGGIFYDMNCKQTNLNHVVTVVGYGETDGEGYWIVKNSWGINWGIDGYFFISMRDNNCGVTTKPVYPLA